LFEPSNKGSALKTAVTPVLENCLESILQLSTRNGAARVRDLAQTLAVHKSTVTATLRSLANRELVHYSAYEQATLTDRGRQIAEQVARRHDRIRRFLIEALGVDERTADSNACRMEHVMDAEVLERLDRFTRRLPVLRRSCRPAARGKQGKRR
jgi:DtxR family transcriptional regulator, Mn-dependent transcriptional regulator